MTFSCRGFLVLLLLSSACGEPRRPAGDYLAYIRQAPEFRRVRQEPFQERWDTWLYMPWRYRWHIGTGDRGGEFCRDLGINGGVMDRGRGPLEWLERWNLRFYNDHTAGKGSLYLLPDRLGKNLHDIRPRPITPELERELGSTIASNLALVKRSPLRVAYSLDDEISTGSFVRPIPWRLNADDQAYERWLRTYYGGDPPPARFAGPDEVRGDLDGPLRDIDLSPFLDRMTYNDSVWANFVGRLVERCNREDPSTPCGFVGGQGPSLWGGYDWAKLAKKVQFVEAYDHGSAPEIVRSFSPTIPRISTHFHDGQDVRTAWRRFAHGDRGMVGWVEGWFSEDGAPLPWLERFRPTLKELGGVQGPKLIGATRLHDGIAIYYSHPSIQVSWMLDAEPHGRTWPNRNDDHRLGTSHNVRRAWETMLQDAGLGYDFLAYDEVVLHGVPSGYKALILPAAYALSDIEARRIADFAAAGGTVIADFACGLFDQHGRGRSRGALDDLFGVRHDGTETREDFFGGKLWVETDQEEGFHSKSHRELLDTVTPKLHQGFAVAERKLPVGTVRQVGKGKAVYLNLSPQRYLVDRDERRRIFLDPLGIRPWIEVSPPKLETVSWSKDGRMLVLILAAEPIADRRIPVRIRLAAPVTGAVDERTGRPLPDGDRFQLDLDPAEAVFLSFRSPRGAVLKLPGP